MDWKRVKTILIALLLVTNLILGYSVYGQYRSLNQTEGRALEQALQLAGEASGLTHRLLDDLPGEMMAYSTPRDSTCEAAFARALLGEAGFVEENAGGGIVLYHGEKGRGEIKSAGEMEFRLDGPWEQEGLMETVAAMLAQAGLEAGSNVMRTDAGIYVYQRFEGLPLDHYQLVALIDDSGALSISGRWLLCREAEAAENAPQKSELVLYLSRWLESAQAGAVTGLAAGYRVADSRVSPVWFVALESGVEVFDLMERRMVS